MKTKVTEGKFRSALRRAGRFFTMVALGAAILTCSSASAHNLFVSGTDSGGGEIFKFTWDGAQSIFASGLYKPRDLAVDSAGNVFVMDYMILGESIGNAAIFKITPNGMLSIFASRVSYASSLAVNKAGNLFVADYDNGTIYQYKPSGSRATARPTPAGHRRARPSRRTTTAATPARACRGISGSDMSTGRQARTGPPRYGKARWRCPRIHPRVRRLPPPEPNAPTNEDEWPFPTATEARGRWDTARDMAAIVLANLCSFGFGEVLIAVGVFGK